MRIQATTPLHPRRMKPQTAAPPLPRRARSMPLGTRNSVGRSSSGTPFPPSPTSRSARRTRAASASSATWFSPRRVRVIILVHNRRARDAGGVALGGVVAAHMPLHSAPQELPLLRLPVEGAAVAAAVLCVPARRGLQRLLPEAVRARRQQPEGVHRAAALPVRAVLRRTLRLRVRRAGGRQRGRGHPPAARRQRQGVAVDHVRVQQLLHLLHRAVRAWARALPPPGGDRARGARARRSRV